MFIIESDSLKVSIRPKGAELTSVYHKKNGLEYMWDADPAFWAKTSPVLFPIVGTLKNNQYSYAGRSYGLNRHGFARDREFEVTSQSQAAITFAIKNDAETEKVYPFLFIFSITYSVAGPTLAVTYTVQNSSNGQIYFSVGGHPAFKLPLTPDTAYEDYVLRFNETETAGRWPISKDGLIETAPEPLLNDTDTLPLSKTLFAKDALVLKHLASDEVSLVSAKTAHGLRFRFPGFPFLGLWAAPGADFLCIEPWCGIADSVNSSGNWPDKEGLQALAATEVFERSWEVTFF